MEIRIPWTRIVELAETIEREYALHGIVDADLALRLVRGVLQFQEQLVAGMVRPVRGPDDEPRKRAGRGGEGLG